LLPVLERKHNITITICWNVFATSHGKVPVDGIGGSLKRHVSERVNKRKNLVDNAEMFVAAAQDMPTVKIRISDDIC